MTYKDICILHTNDTHSYIESFPKRAAIIKKIRQSNKLNGIETYLFDSGDIFSGSIYFNIFKGDKEIELMNELDYDAITLGNHEFDQGDILVDKLIKQANFPIISTNIKFKENLTNVFDDCLKLNSDIYVIGATTQETLDVSSPTEKYVFKNPIKSIIRKIYEIKNSNKNAHIFLISHLGINKDIELLEYNLGINLIIGGHTHTVLEEPIRINDGLIVQAGQYGRYIGKMYLRLYEDGSCNLLNYELIKVETTNEEDEKISKIVNEAIEISKKLKFKYIGETNIDLIGDRKSLNEYRANLAPIVTDSYIYAAKNQGYIVDGSLINGWGIRSSILKGSIYFNDIINVLPFSTSILILEIKGKDLKEALNNGICPQVSKILFEYNKYYIEKNGNLEEVVDEQIYNIVTNSFVAEGKDNYQSIKNSKIIANLGLDVDILSNYIENNYKKISF